MLRRCLRLSHRLATAFSLAGLVAVGVLWGRSYYRLDRLAHVSDGWGTLAASVAGTLHVGTANRLLHGSGWQFQSSALPGFTSDWRWIYPGQRPCRAWAGFAVVEGAYDVNPAWVPYRYTVIPYWALQLPLAVLPAWWVMRRLRRRARRRQGLCPRCGYDLRASPGACPECGAVAPQSATSP